MADIKQIKVGDKTYNIEPFSQYIKPTVNSEYYPKFIQTKYSKDSSNWYGKDYPMYGFWETNTICKITVDNYSTKVDMAVKDANANVITDTYATKKAVTQEIKDAIDGLIDGAPGTLNTLKELSAAIGNDKDYAATVTNLITGIDTKVTNEKTRAEVAESGLSTRISTHSAIIEEHETRLTGAETNIAANSDYIEAVKTDLSTNYLPLAGGNLSGHIYLTGAKETTSTGNTSQIIFGTSSNNHVAISSNKNALVINPDSASTNNQIVLYLDQQSSIPSGISTSTVSAGGAISAKTVSATNNISAGESITANGSVYANSARISNGLYVGTSITHNEGTDLAIGNADNGAYVYFVEDVAGGSTPDEGGESNWTIGTNGSAYFASIYEGSVALSDKYAPKKWISANPSVTGLASASTTATGALAVGLGSKAGSNSVAIGESAVSTNSAVAIGKDASGTIGGVAMGYKSKASSYGVAIGTSTTGSYRGVAIGYGAQATTNSINLGDSHSAEYSVVIGVHDSDHRPSINTGSIMIGSNFADTYDDSDGAVNSDDMVTGVGAIAIGSGYYTDDYNYDPPAIASGDYSISIGHRSVTGIRGVGVGGSAYEYGTAVGNNSHASGSGIAYGYGASCNNKYGIAIGRDAKCYGTSTDSANANIAIGYNTNITHSNYWKRIAIGTNATIGAFDNTAIIGTGTATANSQFLIGQSMKIYCAYTSIASTSDRRDKTDVKPVDDSILPFIKDLNPVTFLWNRREDYVEEVKDVENYSEEKCSNEEREQHNKYLHNQKIRETFGFDSNAVNKEKYKEEIHRGKRRQIGFIAQDVLQSMKKHFGDDDNKYLLVNSNLYDLTENHDMEETVVDGVKQESLLTMEYSNFIPLIIKAMQEQQKLIEEQEKRIVELENRLNNILK